MPPVMSWESRRGMTSAGLAAEVIACWECPGLATVTFAYEAVASCPPGAVARSLVKGCVRNACSSVSDRRGDLWRVFALAMRMRSHFRRPQCEASKAPVGHARAYRDILNDALAALSIIRRVCSLRTLLVKAVSNCLDSMLGLLTVLEEESALDGRAVLEG
ncbi:hypothetical protein CRG98_030575 [Punica granatum]|uniref:Uncharacterized protein n=1 Tax=Punica granatum TaxID=22663 RepID=A0A2I0IYB8_PUNGR|nr:hypothetical protein CRG98_030575 [Punica granatum]